MASTEKFVIFDGNALLHRAYHAIPPLTTKQGVLVNAAYGFTAIFLRVLKELKPTYVAVTFDRKEPTFRHKKFEAYKAQREKKPQELYDQIDIIKRIVTAFAVPIFELAGYEADDIIGTLSRQACERGAKLDVVIVTGDMDTLQLVDERTSVYTLKKGINDTITYTPQAVYDRYSLQPDQLIDFKALRGDPSDNIPGARGVGEKTATELVKKFGSVVALLAAAKKGSAQFKQLSIKLQELLVNEKNNIELSKELVTIVRTAPVELELELCKLKTFDRTALVALFQELEFKSLLARVPELEQKLGLPAEPRQLEIVSSAKATRQAKSKSANYHLIVTPVELKDFVAELGLAKVFAFDTETTSLDQTQAELVAISIALRPGEAYCIKVSPQLKASKEWVALGEIFADDAVKKIGHNLKFDVRAMLQAGMEVKNLSFDTLIAAYLLQGGGERTLDLKGLVFQELGASMQPIEELIGPKGKGQITMAAVPDEALMDYACADADYTLQLMHKQAKELKEQDLEQLFTTVEMPLVPVLGAMEREGVKVDTDYLGELAKILKQDISALEKTIYIHAGQEFNINSPKQLSDILFNKLNISVEGIKRTKTGISTAASELEKMRGLHPIIDEMSSYRELTKLLSTYVEAIPELVDKSGRVHTSFNQTVAATGRLSSSDPNLQNIPIRGEWGARIRQAFIAEPGFSLLSADYSQIELRLAAHLAGDKKMIDVFKKGQDVHAATAAFIFGIEQNKVIPDQRRSAKEVNFGVLYGMGAWGLAERTGLTRTEAREFIERYFMAFSGVSKWIEEIKMQAKNQGYVSTLLGRKRYLPEINAGAAQVRAAAERMAVNLPVQGTAADLMKLAMVRVAAELPKVSPQSRMTIQVHDELVFEVPQGEVEKVAKIVKKEMESAMTLSVPIVVEVKQGKNWGEMKKVEA